MTRHYLWNADAELLTKPIPAVLMDLRREDGDNDLLMDALGMSDIMEGVECVALDGVVTQYQKIERIAGQMERVMLRASGDVKPIAHQVSDPFIQLAVLHVAVIFELSDGQTISVFFHNPDTTPKKIKATDELVSWKWMLNKKDVTILVAPEQGRELNVREVARRIMKAAEKNSPAFVRNNAKRAERLGAIAALKGEIVVLEGEITDLEGRIAAWGAPEPEVVEPEPTKAVPAQKAAPKTPLDLTPENVVAVWSDMRDEIERNAPKTVGAEAIAAARVLRIYREAGKAFLEKIDAKDRNSETITDAESALYDKISNDYTAVYEAVVDASGYRPHQTVDEHPFALLPWGAPVVEPDSRNTGAPKPRGANDLTDDEYARIKESARYLRDVTYSIGELVDNDKDVILRLATRLGKSVRDTLLMEAHNLTRDLAHNIHNGLDQSTPRRLRAIDMEDALTEFPGLRAIIDKAKREVMQPDALAERNKKYDEFNARSSEIIAALKADGMDYVNGIWSNGYASLSIIQTSRDLGLEPSLSFTIKAPHIETFQVIDDTLDRPVSETLQAVRDAMRNPEPTDRASQSPGSFYWASMTVTERAKALAQAGLATKTGRPTAKAKAKALLSWRDLSEDDRSDFNRWHANQLARAANESRISDPNSKPKAAEPWEMQPDAFLLSQFGGEGALRQAVERKLRDLRLEKMPGVMKNERNWYNLGQNESRANDIQEWVKGNRDAPLRVYGNEKGLPYKDVASYKKSSVLINRAKKLANETGHVIAIMRHRLGDFAFFVELPVSSSNALGFGLEPDFFGDFEIEHVAPRNPTKTSLDNLNAEFLAIGDAQALHRLREEMHKPLVERAISDGIRVSPEVLENYPDLNAADPTDETDITPEAIAAVDAAYRFANASDEFKAWVAESIEETGYSPFATARAMDERAKANGAMIEWGFFEGAVLDSVFAPDDHDETADLFGQVLDGANWKTQPREKRTGRWRLRRAKAIRNAAGKAAGAIKSAAKAGSDYVKRALSGSRDDDASKGGKSGTGAEDVLEGAAKADAGAAAIQEIVGGVKAVKGVFDSIALDGVDQDGYVGKLRKDGKLIARIDIGDDGKAMIFIGASGDQRVKGPSGRDAMYSDDDAPAMVDWVFGVTGKVEPDLIPENIKRNLGILVNPLREYADGLARARQTDLRLSGGGRYAAEFHSETKHKVTGAEASIEKMLLSIPDAKNAQAARDYIDSIRPNINLTPEEQKWVDGFERNPEPEAAEFEAGEEIRVIGPSATSPGFEEFEFLTGSRAGTKGLRLTKSEAEKNLAARKAEEIERRKFAALIANDPRNDQSGIPMADRLRFWQRQDAIPDNIARAFAALGMSMTPEPATLAPEGAENIVKTAKGREVATGFTVIEAADLIVSHDNQGNPNPDYPPELQPRDRGRETSIAWIRKTANQLDTDSLGKTRRADTGAPIVGPDRVVESGNGRTMAIREAYRTGKADEYRDWLIQEAESFRLNPAKIRAMKHPVLVRVRTSEIDRRTFAIEANQDDKLSMTGTEKARADADRLDDALLSKLGNDGDLLSAANRDFIRGFLASLGDTEAAQYLTTDGQPTGALIARVQAAVFAKAYHDDRLLELTADASKPDVANIINALNASAPEFIRAQAADKAGTDALSEKIADSVDVSLNQKVIQTLIDATNLVRKARADGQDVAEAMSQMGLFESIPPATAAMAIFISKNNRSSKRLGVAFTAMARHVRREAERGQTVDMFGDSAKATLEQIIAAANLDLDREYGEGQFAIENLDLFSVNPPPPPEPPPEPAIAPIEYRYAAVNRPPGYATAPEGYIRIDPQPPKGADHHDQARHGIVVYPRKLTDQEANSYELVPIIEGAALDALVTETARKFDASRAAEYIAAQQELDAEEFANAMRSAVEQEVKGASRYAPSVGNWDVFAMRVFEAMKALHGGAAPAPATDPRAQIIADLQALIDNETDIGRYDAELDRIAEIAEAAGLMEELDPQLNASADRLTELLNVEAARVAQL